jgi:CRISPR-associated protein Csb1
MQVNVGGRVMQELADAQQDELSAKNYTEISKDAKKLKDGSSGSASRLGFGGVPPTLSALAGVNCSRIIRTHVLSFAALRQMRFGSTLEGDIASRSLLAAWALAGLARSDRELYLRANCDLREAAPTEVEMDARGGQVRALAPLTVDEADAVLRQAIDAARTIAGIEWKGQILEVVGNSEVFAGAVDAVDEDN